MHDLRMTGSPSRRVALPATLALLASASTLFTSARPAHAGNPKMSDCLSANEDAIKLRSEHRLIEARDQALACAASSCPAEVRETCEARVRDLNATIPTLVFEVKDARGNDTSAVVVEMDGLPFAERLNGAAVAVDPGDHTFSFAVTGQPKLVKHVVVYEGDKSRRERIQLEAVKAPATGLGARKAIGLTLGGVGFVGLGVGATFGLLTVSAWSRVTNACGSAGTSRCAASSRTAVNSDTNTAQTDGEISTAAFIAGGVVAATGAVLFLTGGHSTDEGTTPGVTMTPTLGPGEAGISLRGVF